MKKISVLGALVAVGLLVGCADSGERSAESSAAGTIAASPSPARVLEDGEALQELANIDTTCERDLEDRSAVFKYFATCGDNVLIEFGPAIDLEKDTKLVLDTYRESNDLHPWLISDEWMIKGTKEELNAIQILHPEAKYFSQKDEGLFTSDVAEAAVSAVERVYGITCEEFYRTPLFFGYEVNAQKQFNCDDTDPIEVFTTTSGVKGTNIFVFETDGDVIGFGDDMSTKHDFDGKDRYGVEGDTVMIAPLPKAKAEEISMLVDGSKVVDISLNPFTDR